MSYQHVLIEKSEGIGLITINREEVRNAIDPLTYSEIIQAMQDFEADEEVGVIILTGAGDKSFAAGSDIRQIKDRTLMDGLAAPPQRNLAKVEDIEKPIIAALNGFALGGGCELSMACDIRIASDRAKLGQPEVNLGFIPGAGGTQRLINLVGLGKAKELIMTGDIIDAAEAERIGLVNKVVPHDELLTAAREMAKKILSKGPLAIRLAKMVMNARIKGGQEAAMLVERFAQSCLMTTEDKIEGTTAFLEKRKPEFKGR